MNKCAQFKAFTLFALSVFLLVCPFAGHTQPRNIVLDLDAAPLKEAMSAIEKQSSWRFVVSPEVDLNYPVTLTIETSSIRDLLERLFASSPYAWSLVESTTTITLSKRPEERPANLTGIVRDTQGNPIIGATVLETGTSNGTTTDGTGRFALTVAIPSTARLEISYLGYESLHLTVGSRTRFEIMLRESTAEIEQVVVAALGIKRSEKALAYTVAQVAPEDVTMVKDANFVNALSGKVAGAVINPSSSGVGGVSKVVCAV